MVVVMAYPSRKSSTFSPHHLTTNHHHQQFISSLTQFYYTTSSYHHRCLHLHQMSQMYFLGKKRTITACLCIHVFLSMIWSSSCAYLHFLRKSTQKRPHFIILCILNMSTSTIFDYRRHYIFIAFTHIYHNLNFLRMSAYSQPPKFP